MADPIKIPARATKGQALYTIEQKLVDKERKLTAQDRRRLQDQYDSILTKGYAKGGDVKKFKPCAECKSPAKCSKMNQCVMKKMAKGGLTKKQQDKVGKVMGEFKDKGLHSGKGGPVVKNRKQAVAIALSEAKKAKK